MSIEFVTVDSEQILNDVITAYETNTGDILYPGDEKRIFIQNLIPIIVGLKNNINNTGKSNLLRYATGEVLNAIGVDWFGVTRLPAQKSLVTLRFTLSSIQAGNITIPLGTRATPDGTLFFATKTELVITAGNTYGDVIAEATVIGINHNGFTSTQIKTIVDSIPFVASVSNTDTSQGGSDIESDVDYRERIQISPESFSVAGPTGAYEYWARSADETIADVNVYSPSPGVVNVVVLLDDGEIPGTPILNKVDAVVNARDKRPLTDNVVVMAATPVNYNVTLTYYIATERASEEAAIRSAIEDSGGAIDQFEKWQSERLGKEINPDELRKLMLSAGAFRITLTAPTYTDLDDDEVANLDVKSITYGGLI